MVDFDDDEPVTIPEVTHEPMYPPRQGHHGEAVFAEMWKSLMGKRGGFTDEGQSNYMLCMVLHWRDEEITQRAATVAATFVRWLGTNCGACFIDRAARLQAAHAGDHAYQMAWAVENERKSWLNSGFRTIEHILAPDECRSNGQLAYRPSLLVDDYEAVDAVVCWLSSSEGREFVAECKLEIAHRLLAESVATAVKANDFARVKYLLKDYSKEPA